MGHSMSCTSLSTSVRKSTVTSRSPLGTAVKDAPWEEEGAVAAVGDPKYLWLVALLRVQQWILTFGYV